MTENWNPISGYPLYSVSDAGRILSVATGASRILKTEAGHRGHLRVTLYGEGGPKRFLVHRLVLEAFVGPAPSPEHEGAHGDGDPANNRLANLRWATPTENASDRIAHGTQLYGDRVATSKLSNEAARAIVVEIETGVAIKGIAARHGIGLSAVYRIAKGRTWSAVTATQAPPVRTPPDPARLRAAADACAVGASESAAARAFGVKRTTLRRFRRSEACIHA